MSKSPVMPRFGSFFPNKEMVRVLGNEIENGRYLTGHGQRKLLEDFLKKAELRSRPVCGHFTVAPIADASRSTVTADPVNLDRSSNAFVGGGTENILLDAERLRMAHCQFGRDDLVRTVRRADYSLG